MSSEQQFCLRWHNYQSSLLASLPQLLDGDDLTDVTLMAGGCNLKAHRVVLSACSQYFKELFKVLQPLQHPVVVLPGAKFTDLCALVTFMYSGEVNIYQDQLQGLLSMADALQIRGLADVNTNSGTMPNSDAAVLPKNDAANVATKRSRTSAQSRSLLLPSQTSEMLQEKPTFRHEENTENQYSKNLKKSDNDIYGNMMKALGDTSSVHSIFETDVKFSSFNRKHSVNSEDFELQTETSKKSARSQTSKKTGTNIFVDDHSCLSPKPPSKQDFEDNVMPPVKVKTESDIHSKEMEINNITELESVLKASKHSSLDDVETVSAALYDIQDDRSPSSNDSTLDNGRGGGFNMETDSQRSHMLSQGQDLSTHASPSTSSSHYTKLWSSSIAQNKLSMNSKLFATCFVCGKQLSNQYNLRVHMETHQNVNYACNVCNHVSRSRDALRKHVSYRHPGESKEKGGIAGNSFEGQTGLGNETVGRSKKSKMVTNKDTNNNKRPHP